METVFCLLNDTLSISIFVIVMMLIIEYVNVVTNGTFVNNLQKRKSLQILIAVILGVLPGCLGTYTVVSLFMHKVISIGALTAALIATFGDESFFLLSLAPAAAFKLFAVLFVISLVIGFLVDFFVKDKFVLKESHSMTEIHSSQNFKFSFFQVKLNIKNISFQRAILIFGIVVFVICLFHGTIGHHHMMEGFENLTQEEIHIEEHEHHHESFEFNWFNTTMLVAMAFLLFIIITVPDDFLTKNMWGHILKRHFLKITLWTFFALVLIKILVGNIEIGQFVHEHLWLMLIVAVLIGIIPESGPHMIFVTMFVTGSIPFSILMANSIVQDGHGALPLFAESPRSFLFSKIVSIVVGLIFGGLGLLIGF